MEKFYQLKTNEDGTNELLIYGDITSMKWFEDDVCSYDLAKEISGLQGPIKVRINSYGGEVSQGLAIYNLLKDYKDEVITMCDVFACSAASLVFAAGNKRVMPKSSLLMIHNAWSWASGDSNALKKASEDLEKITLPSIEIYKSVSNLSEEKIIEMMDRETWISAEEALSYGFATEIKNETPNQSLKDNYLQKAIMENKVLKAQLENNEREKVDYKKIEQAFEESMKKVNKEIKQGFEEFIDKMNIKIEKVPNEKGWDNFFDKRKKEEK